MKRLAFVLVALGGCRRIESVPQDAAVDAPRAVRDGFVLADAIDESRMPFTTTGTTPAGSLDAIRFIAIRYFTGFCQPGYYVYLYRTNDLAEESVVTFYVPITGPNPPTGTTMASAWPSHDYAQMTEAVTLEIVHLDVPPTDPLWIAGRMLIQMGAWNVDFTIDGLTQAVTCI